MNFDVRTLKTECIQCMRHVHEMFKDGADDTERLMSAGDRVWNVNVSDYGDFYGVKVVAYDHDKQIYELRYGGTMLDGSTLFKNIIDTETDED